MRVHRRSGVRLVSLCLVLLAPLVRLGVAGLRVGLLALLVRLEVGLRLSLLLGWRWRGEGVWVRALFVMGFGRRVRRGGLGVGVVRLLRLGLRLVGSRARFMMVLYVELL
jgi:hypothetical protein